MERYTPEQITEVLRLHKLWLDDEEGGVRANLVRANLDGANLVRANLYGANLDGANLDGANLDGANLVRAKNFSKFISVGPIGSRNGYTYIHLQEDKIRCGCFTGTLKEFEKAVRRTHADAPVHLAGYLAVVAMAEAVRKAQPPAAPQEPEAPAPFAENDQVKLLEPQPGPWNGGENAVGKVMACSQGWTRVRWTTGYWNSYRDELLVSAAVTEKAAV